MTASLEELEKQILTHASTPAGEPVSDDARLAVDALLDALEAGDVRAAERDASGNWRVNAWVKRGILLGFRIGKLVRWGA